MEYSGKGIYNSKGKAIRVMGETGGVPNSRRIHITAGSKYNMGTNAHSNRWSLGANSPYGRGMSKSIKGPKRRKSRGR